MVVGTVQARVSTVGPAVRTVQADAAAPKWNLFSREASGSAFDFSVVEQGPCLVKNNIRCFLLPLQTVWQEHLS